MISYNQTDNANKSESIVEVQSINNYGPTYNIHLHQLDFIGPIFFVFGCGAVMGIKKLWRTVACNIKK